MGYSDAEWVFIEGMSALAGGAGAGSHGASISRKPSASTPVDTHTGTRAAKASDKSNSPAKNNNPTSAKTDEEAGKPYNHPVKEINNSVRIPENPAQAKHIFRNDDGHISDTPQNRAMLINIANDKQKVLGNDRHGTTWASTTNADGSQSWVQYRGNRIVNGGINKIPRDYNPVSGLSKPNRGQIK